MKMTPPANRALLLCCLFFSPAFAFGQTKVEVGRTGGGNVNTGLSGSGTSAVGNNTNLGAGSIKAPTGGVLRSAPVATLTPAANAASAARPVAPAAQAGPAAIRSALPSAQAPAAVSPSPASPQTGPGRASAVPEAATAPGAAPSVARTLDRQFKGLKAGPAAAGQGLDDAAVISTLDRIFDAAQHSGSGASNAMAGVKGSALSTGEKIKKTVALANTAAPRDAPDLYKAAINTAKDSLPANIADMVRTAVLTCARKKAELSLSELANGAYRDAVAGLRGDVQKSLKALDKWDSLLSAPGRPLVSNLDRLQSDINKVLEKSSLAAGPSRTAGSPAAVPHIWFARSGWSFSAVLPAASLPSIPMNLAETLALRDAAASVPFSHMAFLAFQARPTAANGARLVYRANRDARGSALGSAYASAKYWAQAVWGRIWRALRGLFMRLTGRGRDYGLDRGFSVQATAKERSAIWESPKSYRRTVLLPGARLELRSEEP
ncbi:MAG: hypothetical protein WC881_10605, partial [Elusimicrobiota bacterium]